MSGTTGFSPTIHSARRAAQRDSVPESRIDEHTRWLASRIVAAVALTALVSVSPTPLRSPLQGVFGGQGVIGPLGRSTAVIFWAMGLLLTARGLRHGRWLAWFLTMCSLGVAMAVQLTDPRHYYVAALLALGVAYLVAQSRSFGVHTGRDTAAKVIVVMLSVLGLGVALLRVVAAAILPEFPPVAGPFGVGVASGLVSSAVLLSALVVQTVTLWVVLSPRAAEKLSEVEHRRLRDRARQVVATHGDGTLDYFALREDKRWFFHGESVVAYAVRFGVCLVSPDPIGPDAERRVVWTAFMDHVRSHGWSVSVMGAGEEWIGLYESFGLRALYLGDEALVDCSDFTLDGRSRRGLRQACNRVERAGYTVTFHDPTRIGSDDRRALLELAKASRSGTVERGFSMTLSRLFEEDDTGLLLSVTRDQDGRPRAFIQWTPAPGIRGWSLDVMRHDTGDDVPNGMMEHLIVETIQHLASRGEVGLGLNFAVLRTLVTSEARTRAQRVRRSAVESVARRTQIHSLGRFNEKFCPDWRPRYVVLSSIDTVGCQVLMIAAAEGVSELPAIGRFMKGAHRLGDRQRSVGADAG